jgi:hypothetical protein
MSITSRMNGKTYGLSPVHASETTPR